MNTDKFERKNVNEEQNERMDQIRVECDVLFTMINELVKDGREKSLAITKLEETCMWAIKAITREG